MDREGEIKSERSVLASMFLGPQAENADLVEKLIVYVLRDYVFWRRNFQPEDPFVIREIDKTEPRFEHLSTQLHQNLLDLLGALKGDNIPFASPRYIGHMLSDQLIPAMVGYFAAMLYNPNNVTQEASPKTTELEDKVKEAIACLVGYDRSAWGHLCSGGTVANIEALWVARNAKWLPVAILRVQREFNENLTRGTRCDITFTFERLGQKKIKDLELWDLCNIKTEEVTKLFDCSLKEIKRATGKDRKTVGRKIRNASIAALGVEHFFYTLRKEFAQQFDKKGIGVPTLGVVIVPSNCHYSLLKAAEILGIGRSEANVVKIPVRHDFTMDIAALKSHLERCLKEKIPVLSVVSVCGSTEEAAVDSIDEVERLRKEFFEKGLYFVHHCDAAYGGYARTLVFDGNLKEKQNPTPIESRLDSEIIRERRKPQPCERVWNALRAIPLTDSITIDPHKLGYVPYPAGAILFRNRDVKELISFDPAYLEEKFIGGYILEGSKPGAAAAACWLSMRSFPLHENGHGILIRRTLKNANTFAESLVEFSEELEKKGVKLRVVNYPPDLNIVCFIFNVARNDSLWLMNAYEEYVFDHNFKFDRTKALSEHQFILSYTTFSRSEYPLAAVEKYLNEVEVDPIYYLEGPIDRSRRRRKGDDRVFVFRATVMNPWLGVSIDNEGNRESGAKLPRTKLVPFIDPFLKKLGRSIEGAMDRNKIVEYIVNKRKKKALEAKSQVVV